MSSKNLSDKNLIQNLSSLTLFHFTSKIDYVIDSIVNGFLCRYHFEKFPLVNSGYISPMKCFCDTPLSLIRPHLSWYGNFGVGISKKYGRELGITPVFYLHSESSFMTAFRHSIVDGSIESDPLLAYYKKYFDNGRRYYDEREWRYVPDGDVALFYKNYRINDIDSKLSRLNSSNKIRLKIKTKYIEYIIVDSRKDVGVLLSAFKKIASKKKFFYEELVSKILTVRQIRRDF
jgi:hypothetical protein